MGPMISQATVTKSRLTGHWIVSNYGPHRQGSSDPSDCGWRRWSDAMADANDRVARARAEARYREARRAMEQDRAGAS